MNHDISNYSFFGKLFRDISPTLDSIVVWIHTYVNLLSAKQLHAYRISSCQHIPKSMIWPQTEISSCDQIPAGRIPNIQMWPDTEYQIVTRCRISGSDRLPNTGLWLDTEHPVFPEFRISSWYQIPNIQMWQHTEYLATQYQDVNGCQISVYHRSAYLTGYWISSRTISIQLWPDIREINA